MTLNDLIKQTGITKNHLAKKLNMSRGSFGNKINPTHKTKFTPDEHKELIKSLYDIGKELREFCKETVAEKE